VPLVADVRACPPEPLVLSVWSCGCGCQLQGWLQARQLVTTSCFHSVVLAGVKHKARTLQAAIDAAFEHLPVSNGRSNLDHSVVMARIVSLISKVGQDSISTLGNDVYELLKSADAQRLLLQSYASGSVAAASMVD
jgi:hypothetical protein